MKKVLQEYARGISSYELSESLTVNEVFLRNLKNNLYYFGYPDLHKCIKDFLDGELSQDIEAMRDFYLVLRNKIIDELEK